MIQTPEGLINNTPSFEKFEIHENLFILRDKSNKKVIGYISKHPDNHWLWFMGNTIKEEFETFQEASEDLAQSFITYKMNAVAKKINTFDNKDLTKF